MRWMETVALGIFVFELTGSPFWVALIGFLRMVPMFIFGPFVVIKLGPFLVPYVLCFGNTALCCYLAVFDGFGYHKNVGFYMKNAEVLCSSCVWYMVRLG